MSLSPLSTCHDFPSHLEENAESLPGPTVSNARVAEWTEADASPTAFAISFLAPSAEAIVTPYLPLEFAEHITSTWLESSSGPCLTWRSLSPLYHVGVTFLVTISFRTHIGAEASTLQTDSLLFSIESMEVSLVFLYICSCYFASILLCVWTREIFFLSFF